MARGVARISKSLRTAKIAFDEAKHKRDGTGKFADQIGKGDDAPKKPRAPAAAKPAAAVAESLKLPGKGLSGPGKLTGITADDRIRVVTKSQRFSDGQTIRSYIDKVGGDKDKALRRIAREIKEGRIKIEDAKGAKPEVPEVLEAKLAKATVDTPAVVSVKNADTGEVTKKLMTGFSKSTVDGKITPKVGDLADDVTIYLVAKHNPYQLGKGIPGSGAFQDVKTSVNGWGSMKLGDYKAGKKVPLDQKMKGLQQLVDDGHVTLHSNSRMLKIEEVKRDFGGVQKIDPPQAAKNWKSDDPRWAKAGGVTDLRLNKNTTEGVASLKAARDSADVPVVSATDSKAVRSYTGSGHSGINRGLRFGSELTDGQKSTIKSLDKIVNSSRVKNDTFMYRGVGLHSYSKLQTVNLNDMPPPPDFVDRGYSSMSLNPAVSQGFAGSDSTSLSTLFRVRVPKGAPGAFFARLGHSKSTFVTDEAEFVSPRNTRYRWVSTTMDETPSKIAGYPSLKRKVVELEIVQEDGTPYDKYVDFKG